MQQPSTVTVDTDVETDVFDDASVRDTAQSVPPILWLTPRQLIRASGADTVACKTLQIAGAAFGEIIPKVPNNVRRRVVFTELGAGGTTYISSEPDFAVFNVGGVEISSAACRAITLAYFEYTGCHALYAHARGGPITITVMAEEYIP